MKQHQRNSSPTTEQMKSFINRSFEKKYKHFPCRACFCSGSEFGGEGVEMTTVSVRVHLFVIFFSKIVYDNTWYLFRRTYEIIITLEFSSVLNVYVSERQSLMVLSFSSAAEAIMFSVG